MCVAVRVAVYVAEYVAVCVAVYVAVYVAVCFEQYVSQKWECVENSVHIGRWGGVWILRHSNWDSHQVCCSELQCVAVCCTVLHCVALGCSVAL